MYFFAGYFAGSSHCILLVSLDFFVIFMVTHLVGIILCQVKLQSVGIEILFVVFRNKSCLRNSLN